MSREKLWLSIEIAFLRIPTEWTMERNDKLRWVAVPAVTQATSAKIDEIDGWGLRRRFLRLKPGDRKAALQFLQDVGVFDGLPWQKPQVQISLDCSPQGSVNVQLGGFPMPEPIEKRLAALPTMSKAELCDLWKQFFHSDPSSDLRRDLMIPILAYRIQEQAFGSLGARARERLRQLSLAFEKGSDSAVTGVPRIRPGTRLVRQWGDQVHLVNVHVNGYEYQGTRYRSLSEIARLITGTRWSGPTVFRNQERIHKFDKSRRSNECGSKTMMRCAIYTRKSSEEGLEQSFNSLDAQREACEAFIASQRHEGWQAIATRYDDGGYSGGTMERPALKRLLDDIAANKINVIVVYKVDRLTRSLADFAKIVEAFDAKGVSFVSVTQQFNTTSSMGRLTLNILLSFAQFEREVTGERIRDKIAASKKKGMWMGGLVPLGYDLEGRKLVPNPKEAELIVKIFTLYLELGCVRKLAERLDREKIRTKVWITQTGARLGGVAFARGALYHLLRNRLYLGEIRHRDQWYPGEHDGIVPRALCGIGSRRN
jgi:DNA invertase Pin-like site-specific DNA recombinase